MDYLHSCLSRRRGAADDRALLQRFREARDGDAFALMLHRHGPMVLGLARRIVGDWQTAEDVFQATFLMLARKAHTIRRAESLACWLHGVAFRLARRARCSRQRRQERETHVHRSPPPTPLDELTAREFLAVLDEELRGLPENHRAALILCCLEGLSQEEAARRLGCSAGAVKGRLERGRNQLRRRLAKRGLMLPAVLAGSLLVAGSARAVPRVLAQSTLQAARTGAGATPAAVALVHEAMRSVVLNKLKAISAAVLLLAVTGGGLGVMTFHPQTAKESTSAAAVAPNDRPVPSDQRVDLYGDRLPEGAVMRLGTLQRRAVGAQLAVTADGKSIVSVRGGKYLRIWDAATGELRAERQSPGSYGGNSVFSPDGHRLLTGLSAGDHRLKLWNVQTGTLLGTLAVEGAGSIWPAAFSPDGKAVAAAGSAGNEHYIRVWELATGKVVFRKDFHGDAGVRRTAFTPDGRLLSSAHPAVLDLATGRIVESEKMPAIKDSVVLRMLLSPDGRTLFVSTFKGVIVWDRVHGKELRTLAGAGEQIAVWPDGRSILTNNAALQRWNVDSGKPLFADTFARGHTGEVSRLAWSADGRRLAPDSTGIGINMDGTLRVWDAVTGRPLHLQHERRAMRLVSANALTETGDEVIDLGPDGRWLLTNALGETSLRMWEADTGKAVRTLEFPAPEQGETARRLFRARFSPDGARVVGLLGGQSNPQLVGETPPAHKVVVWDVKSGARLHCRPVGWTEAVGSAIAPDGRTVLSSGVLIDTASGKELARLEGMNPRYTRLNIAFSRDGALVAGESPVYTETNQGLQISCDGVRIWEAATGKMVAHVKMEPRTEQVLFHPDNRFVATNDVEGIRIWVVVTGKLALRRVMPEIVPIQPTLGGFASCPTFAPDGRLATGHPDGTILLWDIPLPARKTQALAAEELELLWADLAGADAAKAWRAVWRMAEAPKDTLPLLRQRVRPYPTAPADVTRKLLVELDGDSFEQREAAVKRLKELGLQAEPALRAALRAQPSLEQRKRIESVLAALKEAPQPPAPEELRPLRAIVVLERIGSPEARRVLEELARGPKSARRTRQALMSLACLRKSSR
jgi:RNA polymerase sigma factor (sigma-70 family)